MNEFASTTNPSTQGLLKNSYEQEPVSEALKRRLKKKQQQLVEQGLATEKEDENA